MTAKEIDAKIVYEDEQCMAVLDIHPATTGHLILFPKEHYPLMPMVPDETMSHLSVISNYLCDLLSRTFSPEDVSVFIANGAAAGQQSQHFLMHLIPRYGDDGIDFDMRGEGASKEELQALAQKLCSQLQQ
jgi:histidine triad (HIT) family protein